MTTISERLRLDSKGDDAFVAIVPLHGLRHEAADTIDALVAALESMREYGVAPSAVEQQADAALALAHKGGE